MAQEAKAGHTKGPWRFDGDWYAIPTIFGADGKVVASVEKDGRKPTPERAANAALLTAAPDLLAAAKRVLAHLNARIDAADGSAVPVFDGIVELHAAINRASPPLPDTAVSP